MGEEVGTTYFAYRGPSPNDTSSHGQANRNTVRSAHSGFSHSDRGDNNEITTLAVRPYTSSLPDLPHTQSVILLSPPYPGYYPSYPHLNPYHHHHTATTTSSNNNNHHNGFVSRPYLPLTATHTRDAWDGQSVASQRVYSDLVSSDHKPDTLKVCALFMAVIFVIVFAVAIFMAVYYGNSFY